MSVLYVASMLVLAHWVCERKICIGAMNECEFGCAFLVNQTLKGNQRRDANRQAEPWYSLAFPYKKLQQNIFCLASHLITFPYTFALSPSRYKPRPSLTFGEGRKVDAGSACLFTDSIIRRGGDG